MPCWCAHVPIPHCPHCFHTCDPSLDSTTLVMPCWCARSKRRRHCPVRIFHTLMRPSWEPEGEGGGGRILVGAGGEGGRERRWKRDWRSKQKRRGDDNQARISNVETSQGFPDLIPPPSPLHLPSTNPPPPLHLLSTTPPPHPPPTRDQQLVVAAEVDAQHRLVMHHEHLLRLVGQVLLQLARGAVPHLHMGRCT